MGFDDPPVNLPMLPESYPRWVCTGPGSGPASVHCRYTLPAVYTEVLVMLPVCPF